VDDLGPAFRPAPEEDYTVPLGVADIKRHGRDLTIVATGMTLHKALAAAAVLAAEGIEAEVIDPRTLVPLDRATIIESVKRTGRLVVASEDVLTCGVASEISALVAEEALWYLDAPIRRIAVPDTPIPFAPAQERAVLPQVESIAAAARDVMHGPDDAAAHGGPR
jgi:pyruvate dehydrogenase E1 component beta subunit